ncbi:MAG: Gfo/Idh/MocA family oxidoreductase [Kiritimatiellia bacterium]|jgi:predicted dehydrogenase|nr:Gfo/Idh/MocA family oxidoreductase [Kiritimatiellia bacterium]MDP6631668.1 Gfo/Idh/MocA family oxidoreductase [Kiritimatiellia bacterium]MDP6810766.1 Gfo/Idh/MocA family oxidoreductase [Kiritimatiellia bacterium]MDP7022641.1 Gfo/Idh/MocA family oxidoreductase [Kiritimatiellia bacterium]
MASTTAVRVALVGIGGHGQVYVDELLDRPRDTDFTIVGGIDPAPEGCSRLTELRESGVPLFDSLEAFYDSGGEADLVMIVSPIHFHRSQTELALANGASVLCEKPLCATIQDAHSMLAAEEAAAALTGGGPPGSRSRALGIGE